MFYSFTVLLPQPQPPSPASFPRFLTEAMEQQQPCPMKRELGEGTESPNPLEPTLEGKESPNPLEPTEGKESPNSGAKETATEAKAKTKAEASKPIKNLQTSMLAALKKPGASQDAQELLRLYEELPRFSETKRNLVERWAKDKSCKWLAEVRVVRTATAERSSGSSSAWGNQWQLAKLLGMDAESDSFKDLLKGIPGDQDR